MSKEEAKKYRNQILRRLAAFSSLKTSGMDYACKAYPEEASFLLENKDKIYEEIVKELSRKLELV